MRLGNMQLCLCVTIWWSVVAGMMIDPSKVAGLSTVHVAGDCHYMGFDLGTSGARVSVVQVSPERDTLSPRYEEVFSYAIAWDEDGGYDDPSAWLNAVHALLRNASEGLGGSLQSVHSICVSGTSASCLLVDSRQPHAPVTRLPRMYNYDVVASNSNDPSYAVQALDHLDKYAPPKHTARARTGSLAKLLDWNQQQALQKGEIFCHQADYVALQLMSTSLKQCGSGTPKLHVCSDWHNCLKLGYDVRDLQWPKWLVSCLVDAGIPDPVGSGVLPSTVVSPGTPIGKVSVEVADEFGFSHSTVLVGGTTDSNAAFFAAVGGTRPSMGTAVTSLGSTLAMKLLSRQFVEDASRGVYSHRFPVVSTDDQIQNEAWLIGGASNVGCAVLRQEGFSSDELVKLSEGIDPSKDIDLSYYPLTAKGERFPTADSEKEPFLQPVPASRKDYLHGILQGISQVERDGFRVLGDLGASPSHPTVVWTCGGGSVNDMWSKMRQRKLSSAFSDDDLVVRRADNTEASYGAAILAAASFS